MTITVMIRKRCSTDLRKKEAHDLVTVRSVGRTPRVGRDEMKARDAWLSAMEELAVSDRGN
jgi:hypothetical protein